MPIISPPHFPEAMLRICPGYRPAAGSTPQPERRSATGKKQ
ncbi:MAG: hypothetical protein E7L08_01985 [Klebsiella michiganensis]|nr:hypothetical protein [Klebsiella michiganensis]